MIRIYRTDREILHTFERYDGSDWCLTTPANARFRRRTTRPAGSNDWRSSELVGEPPRGEGEKALTVDGTWAVDRRSANAWREGESDGMVYDLGAGIPVIAEPKLHRILDGLDLAGIGSIDAEGLKRLITARR